MLAQFEAQRSGRDIVLKPRQVFFTTWECARDLWWLLTQDASHTVILAPSDSENYAIREVATRVEVMLGLDNESWRHGDGLVGRHPWLADLLRWEEGELRFGAARLEIKGAGAAASAARKVGRSGTVHRLHVTEISSFEFAEITWTSIHPTVPSGGDRNEITIESTAQGAGGLFFALYHDAKAGRNSFRTFFFAWVRHAEYGLALERGEKVEPKTPRERELLRKHRASPEQIKWYRAKVADLGSQDKADQEYPLDEETCWLVAGRLFFDAERIKVLLTETRDPARVEKLRSSVPDPAARNELRVWKEPFQRDAYVVVADPSEGVVDGDPCAAAVYHRATGEHVATLHGLWRTHEFATHLDRLGRRYNNALMVVERANHGNAVLNALLRLGVREDEEERRPAYPAVYEDEDGKPGWKTGEVPRATAAEALEEAVRSGAWKSPCRLSVAEMQRFVINKKGKPEAGAGAHDDLVLVHVIGWTILSRPIQRRPATGKSDLRYASAEGGRGFY
jgi:hypothetical protein